MRLPKRFGESLSPATLATATKSSLLTIVALSSWFFGLEPKIEPQRRLNDTRSTIQPRAKIFSCDHRPTETNSERSSSVRNRKNCGENQTRKARRLPRHQRTQTNRIKCQTKQRRKIRLAGVLPRWREPLVP